MPVHHSSQVLDRIHKDFTFRWFALQACSFHASRDIIEPIKVVFQGRCRYDYVIHVTHHEIPVLLSHSGQSLSHQSLKSGRCIAQAEWHPLPLVQPNSHANSVFSLSFFRKGTCQKAEPKSNVVKNLASPSLERLSSIRGIRYASFIVTALK